MNAIFLLILLPEFIWDGIFMNLNVFVPAFVLALFNARYQHRWKKEFQIMGNIASLRIEAYERILAILSEVTVFQTTSLEEEAKAKKIFSSFEFRTVDYDYPSFFRSEASFDDFYKRLVNAEHEYEIYLDYEVLHVLQDSIAIFTHYKNSLDAFSDTERNKSFGFSSRQVEKHIEFAYQLCGMAMSNDCTRAYVQLDEVICRKLNNFHICYRHHYFMRTYRSVAESVGRKMMRVARINKTADTWVTALLFRLMPRNVRNQMGDLLDFTQVLQYVHFSDNYQADAFFDKSILPPVKEIEKYAAVFMSQLHYV